MIVGGSFKPLKPLWFNSKFKDYGEIKSLFRNLILRLIKISDPAEIEAFLTPLMAKLLEI